jgi:hypothetical protein
LAVALNVTSSRTHDRFAVGHRRQRYGRASRPPSTISSVPVM